MSNEAVNASHAEFMDASNKLQALARKLGRVNRVPVSVVAEIMHGAHKLEKAATLLDVMAKAIRQQREELEEARKEEEE